MADSNSIPGMDTFIKLTERLSSRFLFSDPSLSVEEYCGFDIDSQMPRRMSRPEVTDEERDLLAAFRRFKIRMRGREDIFHWKTTAPDGVQIVTDTAEIILPCEVFPGK